MLITRQEDRSEAYSVISTGSSEIEVINNDARSPTSPELRIGSEKQHKNLSRVLMLCISSVYDKS